MVVGAEGLVVDVHQLTLANGGCGLLGGHIAGALLEAQLSNAHSNGAGGYQNNLISGIFQIADDLAQIFYLTDVQVPGGMCQRRSPYFDTDSHGGYTRFPSKCSFYYGIKS